MLKVNLTYADYADMGYSSFNGDDQAFKTAERQAQRAVDAASGYFFQDHDIAKDQNQRRVDYYRGAICEQMEFIFLTGMQASYDSSSDLKAITVGRLNIQPANTAGIASKLINGVCKEAYDMLYQAGLLYRGRGSDWYVATHHEKHV